MLRNPLAKLKIENKKSPLRFTEERFAREIVVRKKKDYLKYLNYVFTGYYQEPTSLLSLYI